ncbi:MAG: hypothetical protein JWL94_1427 [Microbacteriaceae bacterium]|nr:hypothetical protein [Microbacteriaceae bacterium]
MNGPDLGRHSAGRQDGDEQAVEEVADALPGSGRLEEPEDDLNGASGPIQVP